MKNTGKKTSIRASIWAALLAVAMVASAQTTTFTYQGQVMVDATPFTGTGQFKFALVTSSNASHQATARAVVSGGFITSYPIIAMGSGYTTLPVITITDAMGSGARARAVLSGGRVVSITPLDAGSRYSSTPTVTISPPPADTRYATYWSNDGTSVDGSEPTDAVNVNVTDGVFTVIIGDDTLANMQPMDPAVFETSDLQLRVWFNDATHGFTPMDPATLIGSVPYASFALKAKSITGSVAPENLADNSINSIKVEDGSITAADLDPAGFNTTFWKIGGNAGTESGLHFLGTTDDQPLEFHANSIRALRIENTPFLDLAEDGYTIINNNTVSIIGGWEGNSAGEGSYGGVIGGGGSETAPNTVTHSFGTIGGGYGNLAGYMATVAGGNGNTASYRATISGGESNEADSGSFVGGGAANKATGGYSVVSGGYSNIVTGYRAAVGGGLQNTADGNYTTISGGYLNAASGDRAFIGGGYGNTARATWSVVGGGHGNNASGEYSFIGSGTGNTASGNKSFVGGGSGNDATGTLATVGGGLNNDAHGEYATIPGGSNNKANGNKSFAAGYYAHANHDGAFVWGDGSFFATVESTAANQWTVRASGGVRFFSNSGLTSGTQLAAGGTSWSTICDRNAKKNFEPIDAVEVLEKLVNVPVTQWNYDWEDDTATPNIGPVAQEFKAIFYPGRDDTSITTLEFDGVELAAIKGLNQKLQAQDARLQVLEQTVAELKHRLASCPAINRN